MVSFPENPGYMWYNDTIIPVIFHYYNDYPGSTLYHNGSFSFLVEPRCFEGPTGSPHPEGDENCHLASGSSSLWKNSGAPGT